jgi:hypothetical protein
MNMMKICCPMLICLVLLFTSCEEPNPNIDQSGKDELKSLELDHNIDTTNMNYQSLIYVPIYSDIYVDAQNQNSLLAATLSIRNTSHQNSLIVTKIEYFNTEGEMVRDFIENPISLPPMATVNYVIEKEDDTGGSGANFIVELSAKNKSIRPIVQAIMIGQYGNKSFAFSTDGYDIPTE